MSNPSRRRRTKRPVARRISTQFTAPNVSFDPTAEYRFIRNDLVRIVVLGGGLIGLMFILYFARVF